jgi:hypothetical protein
MIPGRVPHGSYIWWGSTAYWMLQGGHLTGFAGVSAALAAGGAIFVGWSASMAQYKNCTSEVQRWFTPFWSVLQQG